MDKLRAKAVESILGIYSPFYIKDMTLNEESELFTIQLDEISNKNKSITSIFRSSSKQINYCWKHVKFGRFNTQIEFKSSESNFNRLTKLVCPAFLGAAKQEYTKQAEELILFAHGNKISADIIATLTGLQVDDISRFILNTESNQITQNTSNLLPLETDALWIKIIKREFPLKTSLTPLRMLLHKLELSEINNSDGTNLQESVATLRAFFIKNKANLSSEYQQIGAKKEEAVNPIDKPATQNKSASKLTPTHPVWDNILTEKCIS